MADHVDLTDPELHEPKGASTASAGEVYVADGAGGGSWQKITSSNFNTSEVDNYIQGNITDGSYDLGTYFTVTSVIDDVSAASIIFIPIPNACTFVSAATVLEGSITASNSTINFYNGLADCGGQITVAQSGSAAGDVDTYTPTANTSFIAGSYLRITSDGASNTTRKLWVTCVFQLA